jgi:hypothetical protein
MRRLLAGALVAALAVGVAWPAGASPGSVASKALRLAAKATRTAKHADKTARQALTETRAGAVTVHVGSGDVPAAPKDFAEFDVKCPEGFAPTGFSSGLGALELVAALATPDGYIGSYFNPSDSQVFSGSLDVICINGRWTSLTKPVLSRRAATSRLRDLERARRSR